MDRLTKQIVEWKIVLQHQKLLERSSSSNNNQFSSMFGKPRGKKEMKKRERGYGESNFHNSHL